LREGGREGGREREREGEGEGGRERERMYYHYSKHQRILKNFTFLYYLGERGVRKEHTFMLIL